MLALAASATAVFEIVKKVLKSYDALGAVQM